MSTRGYKYGRQGVRDEDDDEDGNSWGFYGYGSRAGGDDDDDDDGGGGGGGGWSGYGGYSFGGAKAGDDDEDDDDDDEEDDDDDDEDDEDDDEEDEDEDDDDVEEKVKEEETSEEESELTEDYGFVPALTLLAIGNNHCVGPPSLKFLARRCARSHLDFNHFLFPPMDKSSSAVLPKFIRDYLRMKEYRNVKIRFEEQSIPNSGIPQIEDGPEFLISFEKVLYLQIPVIHHC